MGVFKDNGYLIAVKSSPKTNSKELREEKEVLAVFAGCPNIIQCFGDEITLEDDYSEVYNLLLEYAPGGNLAQRINKSGQKGLPESEGRLYTRSILEGLNYIHDAGYVHCDLKPENILLIPKTTREGEEVLMAKICDFGVAKRAEDKLDEGCRGTVYLPPEAAKHDIQEARGDIWSLGCVVMEMLTRKPVWNVKDWNQEKILKKIAGKRKPKIPRHLSREAKSFLNYCLDRKMRNRLRAATLLCHPFVDLLLI